MSPKMFNSNLLLLTLLINFNFLFLLISAKEEIRKDLFDETKLKHLKIKNRFSVELSEIILLSKEN